MANVGMLLMVLLVLSSHLVSGEEDIEDGSVPTGNVTSNDRESKCKV